MPRSAPNHPGVGAASSQLYYPSYKARITKQGYNRIMEKSKIDYFRKNWGVSDSVSDADMAAAVEGTLASALYDTDGALARFRNKFKHDFLTLLGTLNSR